MKYPIGIQDFQKLREEGFVYVDKTALVYDLAQQGGYYFLGRPRRFGKSLLLSTMHAYFSGKRELFGGLAIERLEREWRRHPVLHLDLNRDKYETPENLDQVLNKSLSDWEALYGKNPEEVTLALRFEGIIQRACEQTGERVVILVDEYDKPLLSAIGKPATQEAYRDTLKALFGKLKMQDRFIRFAFLTGVTKFSHVSVFSDLNNLNDISMDAAYVGICGISGEELHAYFEEAIKELAAANGMEYGETCERLRVRYDGYHFRQDCEGVYNPFSLLNTSMKREFRDYWFETGTPSFLVRLLQDNHYNLANLQGKVVAAANISSVDTMVTDPIPVIYQSGYLTIKDYDEEFGIYSLDFPNEEVERGFINYLVPFYTPVGSEERDGLLRTFTLAIRQGQPGKFLADLQVMLSDNDYRVVGKMELYFQNVLYVVFKLLGFYVEVERATSRGRMDVTMCTPDYVYVMELKLDGSADEALRQIKERQYDLPFRSDPRKVFLVGVNFSSATRNIQEWVVE